MTRSGRVAWVLLALAACSAPDGGDAGPLDADAFDAHAFDAMSDARASDASARDAGASDASTDARTDGGSEDGGARCPEEADCSGLECGPDPICGVSCGSCDVGVECTAGACGCVPDCAGRECGLDPVCNVSCGPCGTNETCNAGSCECVPDCTGRACGPDPICGTSCGSCGANQACNAGVCECVPDCTGRACGPDPICGTTCGSCGANQACNSGVCECVPDCSGRACGPDPICGTSCGSCGPGQPCNAGTCGACVPDCTGRSCGPDPVCGISCGTCTLGVCTGGTCVCTPSCTGRACGSDGCGGTCGACTGGAFCDIAGSCLAPGTCTENAGDAISIDVPVVNVTIAVTLNGAPLSSANSSDTDEGTLWLIDPTTSERISLGDTWNDGTDMPVPPYSLQVIPGVYDVFYAVQDNGPNWPDNTNHRIGQLSVLSSGTYTINVRSVNEMIDVTLGGAPLSSANSSDTDEGTLWLIDPSTNERISLGDTWNDGTDLPVPPYRIQVIPDSYEVFYGVQDNGPHWPNNTNHPLRSLTFSASGSVTVDVPVVDVSIGVTLNGAPLSSANTSDTDEGTLWLIDPTTNERISLGDTWNDGTDLPVPPYAIQVIPSSYDVFYGVQDNGAHWPDNTNHQLGSLALDTSGAFTVDVPVLDASIGVTLNGTPLSGANSSDTDEGTLWLIDPTTSERISLGDTWNDGLDLPVPPYAIQVIPTAYDVYYGVQDNGPRWPDNTNHLVGSLVLSTSGAFSVDVRAVDVMLDVTLGGAPISGANSSDTDEGTLWLIDPTTNERISLGDTWNDGTDAPVPPYSLQVIPATYDAYYGVQDNGPRWPDNTNHRLGALALTSSGRSVVNVPVTNLRVFVTLNGAPLSSANSSDTDEGTLWLIDPTTNERISLGDTWNDGTDMPVPPYSLQVIPATYNAFYSVQDNGPRWPDNTNHQLVCAAIE